MGDSNEHKPNENSKTLQIRNPAQSDIAANVAGRLQGQYLFDEITGEWLRQKNSQTAWRSLSQQSVIRRAVNDALRDEMGGYSASYRNGVLKLLEDELSAPGWETGRQWLPFINGVYNLNTGEFVYNLNKSSKPSKSSITKFNTSKNSPEPSKSQSKPSVIPLFNWELPFIYAPEATCWTFRRWLITVTGNNREIIQMLLAWLVVLIRGRHDLQKFLELTGPGESGKSTYLRICTMLVGDDNQTVTTLKELENRFETANLYGKRLVQITDSASYHGEVSTLKAITGGDPIRYEVKNRQAGQPFTFKGLLMTAANEVIKSSDHTSGFSRRRVPLPMTHVVSPKEKKRYKKYGNIETLIQREAPGIINWLLTMDESIAVQTIRNPSDSIQGFKLEAELQSNSLLRWAHESLSTCADGSETQIGAGPTKNDTPDQISEKQSKWLYAHYLAWCETQNVKPASLSKFSELLVDGLKRWGIETTKGRFGSGGSNVLTGLKLRSASEPELLADKLKDLLKTSAPAIEGFEHFEGVKQTSKFHDKIDIHEKIRLSAANPPLRATSTGGVL